jgi:hypothetical protein
MKSKDEIEDRTADIDENMPGEFIKIKEEFQKKEKEFWEKKDLEFEEYSTRIEKIMWRGIGIFGLIVFVAVLIWGIVNK